MSKPAKKPTPQELRKIEKDRRRKVFEDIQVQGTNNSSIVSKRSVEMIYKDVLPAGEWFKYFVPKAKRRSPAINRGYWIRMESIRRLILRVMDQHPHEAVNVVNLGCGFDPLPFQMLSSGYAVKFFDIDYPDLVKNKLDMINDAPEIQKVIGEHQENGDWVLNCDQYKLIGCDLKDFSRYENIMQKLPQGVTIFIAEVSLAYMHYEDANRIIELSSKVPQSHILILEQILPQSKHEAFAVKMLAHFDKLRSSLKCVQQYPQKADQETRLGRFFGSVEVRDLFENWVDLIDEETKVKVDLVEPFDEWEEFILFCHHYVIVHATNTDKKVYGLALEVLSAEKEAQLDMRTQESAAELKFAASCMIGDDIYVHGGSGQSRSDKIYKNGQQMDSQGPGARMCHQFVSVNDTTGLLVGGRTRPGTALNDVYKFEADTNTWTRLVDLPYGVSRHSVVAVDEEHVLVMGGGNGCKNEVLLYNWTTQTAKTLTPKGTDTVNLHTLASFGCVYDRKEQVGYIVGGVENHSIPQFNNKLYKFWIEGDFLGYEMVAKNANFQRADCKAVLVGKEVFVIGGVNFTDSSGQKNLIVSYNLESGIITNCVIPEKKWKESPPLWIGHNVVQKGNEVWVLYGGAVCYSFGSVYSRTYKLELK